MRGVWYQSLIAASLVCGAVVAAAEPPNLETAAAKAQQCVLTVRMLDTLPEDAPANDGAAEGKTPAATRSRVTVCTGVCVEKGWVVTPAFAGSDTQIRLTIPGGQQAQGQLRVIDEYSGLALLEAETKDLVPPDFAKGDFKIGAWVLSASAWGVEKPVVSFGILSGQDRTIGGMHYPPLLQADLKSTETSSGAALVNAAGALVGVVVLAEDAKERSGWCYAVPISHVQRLLRARSEHAAKIAKPVANGQQSPEGPTAVARLQPSIIILKRRRPVVGADFDGIGENVFVSRVLADSPAAKAGLKVGDIVQAVDGLKIRSVSQIQRHIILYKQPSDVVSFEVRQGENVRTVEVVLGGGIEVGNAPVEVMGEYIRPKVDIQGIGGGRYFTRNGASQVKEVAVPSEPETKTPADRPPTAAEQVKLLEKALERYHAVIALQQEQLIARDKQARETAARIEQLEAELKRLQQAK